MHDVFFERLKYAGTHIAPPDVPLQSIVARATYARKRSKLRAIAVGIGFTIASAAAAAALGTGLLDGVRLWLAGDKMGATVSSLAIVNAPTAADLRQLIRRATFPVVLPVGLPAGTRVTSVRFAPVARPNLIDLEYINEPAKLRCGVILFDSSAVANTGSRPSHMMRSSLWQVGRENASVAKRCMNAAETSRIRSAMLKSNARASLAATLPMLANATILGNARGSFKIAARYGPPDGNAVLVGSQLLQSLPALAKKSQPLLDTHIVYLTNIPTVNGQPDYSKATLTWPRSVVIQPAGVRAINAVLRSLGAARSRITAVLFNESAHYAITIFEGPLPAPGVQAFSVDPQTLKITKVPAP